MILNCNDAKERLLWKVKVNYYEQILCHCCNKTRDKCLSLLLSLTITKKLVFAKTSRAEFSAFQKINKTAVSNKIVVSNARKSKMGLKRN